MAKHKTPRQRAKAALKALIAQAGSKGRLGQALGADRSTAYRWLVLPEAYLAPAVARFGGTPERYRPDLTPFQIQEAMKPPTSPPAEAPQAPQARAEG